MSEGEGRRQITIICVSLRPGGTERIVCRVANQLARENDVAIVTLAKGAGFYELSEGVRHISPEFGPRSMVGLAWYLKVVSFLWRGLRSRRGSMALIFGEAIAPVSILVSRLAGSRCIVFNRASPVSALKGIRGVFCPITYPLTERVVVQTRQAVSMLKGRYRYSRFEVWENPLDLGSQPAPMDNREHSIINVGTLGGKKNQEGLIDAFSKISSGKHWKLEFVGEGPNRGFLERKSVTVPSDRSVEFLGQQQNIEEHLARKSIFAFTSLTEGFPNALAEAMVAGCACISYDCLTGPSELIEHGVNGFLVELGDEAEFVRLLQVLIDDAELRARFSRNARESMKRFDAASVLAKLEEMIDEVTGRAQGAR